MPYAGFWIRVGASLIDTIVLYIVLLIFTVIFGMGIGTMSGLGDAGDTAASGISVLMSLIFSLIFLVISVGYFVVLESGPWQATLGKKAVGIIVTDENGRRISQLRALGRYFAKILSGITLLIGYIMVAFTDKKQGMHDMVADTLVLKGKPGDHSTAGVFD